MPLKNDAIVWNAFSYLCSWRSIAANWKTSLENWERFFCEVDDYFQSGRRPHLYAHTFPRIKPTVPIKACPRSAVRALI